jgi:hypothetical protein
MLPPQNKKGNEKFNTLNLLKLIYIMGKAGLSIQNLKPHAVGYITGRKITVVNVNTAHQKLRRTLWSLS